MSTWWPHRSTCRQRADSTFWNRCAVCPRWSGIPVMALANRGDEKPPHGKHPVEFEDFQMKFDRDAMLRSLAKLSAESGEDDREPALAGERK